MSPKAKSCELGEALYVQNVKANAQITLVEQARKILEVGVGDRIIMYEGPWENSVVIMPAKPKQKKE